MSFPYRCCKCRSRNTSLKPVTNWLPTRGVPLTHREVTQRLREVGGKRCKHCGHTSFYLDAYRMKRKPCRCSSGLIGRTGAIPHRWGSPCCIHRQGHEIAIAARSGASDSDLVSIIESMLRHGEPVPQRWLTLRDEVRRVLPQEEAYA